jgi:hypothetical protein
MLPMPGCPLLSAVGSIRTGALGEFGRAHRGEVATPYGSLVREGEHLRELGEAEPELLGAAEEPER